MQSKDAARADAFRPVVLPPARNIDARNIAAPEAGNGTDPAAKDSDAKPAFLVPSVLERRARHPESDDTRNGIFERLVAKDDDVTGLVAYSIYKQHKRDWLKSFEAGRGRAPTLDEETAYTIGEATPRRLAMYRHFAGETLAGQLPDVTGDAMPNALTLGGTALAGGWAASPARRSRRRTQILLGSYAVIGAFALLGLWVALRYLFPGLGK